MPAGILTDWAGNKMAATGKSFTTLAEKSDTTAPTVLMTSPADTGDNIGSMTKVSLWFSEDITKVSGSITIKNGANNWVMGVTSSKVTIPESELSKMSITLFPGKLNYAGDWKVLIPAGSL